MQTVVVLGEARDRKGGFGPLVAVSAGQADDGVLPAEKKRDGADGCQGAVSLGRMVNGRGGGLRREPTAARASASCGDLAAEWER